MHPQKFPRIKINKIKKSLKLKAINSNNARHKNSIGLSVQVHSSENFARINLRVSSLDG